MRPLGPRPLTPRDGLEWLKQALALLLSRPWLFLLAALLAPAGSALLLALPVWELSLPAGGGWLPVVATVICYGLPLGCSVCVSAGLARALSRDKPPPLRHLLVPTALKVLGRTTLFLFALLLQGYLALYLVRDLVRPAALLADMGNPPPFAPFGVADTLLGTQLLMAGALVLVLQVLFACFVPPLHLFKELQFHAAWRQSFRAFQLNPWLGPVLGLAGLGLILLASVPALEVPAQVLALPLPAYLGALLFVAWNDIFQGDAEDEEVWDQAPV